MLYWNINYPDKGGEKNSWGIVIWNATVYYGILPEPLGL